MRKGPGTKYNEMVRTAEMMVELARDRGVADAFHLWMSTNRTSPEDLRQFLAILDKTPGSHHVR